MVRVVVPGLEGYLFDFYTPGARPLAFTKALQAQTGLVGAVA